MTKNKIKIELVSASKKYNREWIFKDLNFDFDSTYSYAIIGSNGSGKSTLINSLSGINPLSTGKITYYIGQNKIEADSIFNQISLCSPSLELIEEFTLIEAIDFHRKFRNLSFQENDEFLGKIQLENQGQKQIKNFSSGMKQRLKLGFALYSDSPIVLLDEPTINLDDKGIAWYMTIITNIRTEKLVIIASNQKHEYEFCERLLNIVDYK